MFAGHLGAGLAIARADRGTNPGRFVLAALLLDVLLWILVLGRWESAMIPGDFPVHHQLRFVFPYSHSLAATLGWAVLFGIALSVQPKASAAQRLRRGLLIAAAVLSHWALDAIVHAPELPLVGAASPQVGLGLWNRMSAALAIEAAIAIAGLAVFLRGAGLSRARGAGFVALCLVCVALTIAGMTVAPPPPSVPVIAYSSLATICVTCAIAWLLGARRPSHAARRTDR